MGSYYRPQVITPSSGTLGEKKTPPGGITFLGSEHFDVKKRRCRKGWWVVSPPPHQTPSPNPPTQPPMVCKYSYTALPRPHPVNCVIKIKHCSQHGETTCISDVFVGIGLGLLCTDIIWAYYAQISYSMNVCVPEPTRCGRTRLTLVHPGKVYSLTGNAPSMSSSTSVHCSTVIVVEINHRIPCHFPK